VNPGGTVRAVNPWKFARPEGSELNAQAPRLDCLCYASETTMLTLKWITPKSDHLGHFFLKLKCTDGQPAAG